MLLSGQAAARIDEAQRTRVRTLAEARGRRERFLSLLPALRARRELTRFQLYWEAIERTLSARSLTIIDPQATGRALDEQRSDRA